MADESEQQLDHGWVAINKPGIWRFDGTTATFVADAIMDDMVERALNAYENRGGDGKELGMFRALMAALYGTE